jgi:dTDP-4-amino-4,6-dideoxygalactose transaminase
MAADLAACGGSKAVPSDSPDTFEWPITTSEDEEAILEVLRAGSMSGTELTKDFEEEFAEWQGRDYALGYKSGTTSILGAMYGVGVGVGDEVIAPSVTFWATALPAMNLGATPVFADIDPETLCLDPASVRDRLSEHTAAIIVTHMSGHPADMDPLVEIADRHDVALIEDVSHAHGALYDGEKVGNIGDVGAMSLMSEKSFPVGEGGILVTDDREIYERAIALGHYARHDELQDPELQRFSGLPFGGFKHRMNQFSAALGRVQLRQYDERMHEVQDAHHYFWDLLEDVDGVDAHRTTAEDCTMGGWYAPKGLYDPEAFDGLSVERFAEAVRAEGSKCDPGCRQALHLHPLLNDADVYGHGKPTRIAHTGRDVREPEGRLPVAEGIQERVFMMPQFKKAHRTVIEHHADAYRKVAENYEQLLDSSI